MTVPPPLRLARAVVFAAVCLILTSAGHLTASGRPMGAWSLLAGFAGVLGVAFALAGHERSLATITGGLLGGQFMLHALFTAGGGGHHGDLPQAVADSSGGGLGMTAAHLLAALGSGWWLRRGERRAWHAARQFARALVRPFLLLFLGFLGLAGPSARRAAVPWDVPAPRVTALLRHVLVLRGPPSGFRALRTV